MRLTLAAVAACSLGALAHAHPAGWHIGADGAGNVKVDFLWDLSHKHWEARTGFDGVVFDGLQFEEFAQPDPANDYFALAPGAKIVMEIVSFDAGILLWDPADLAAGPMSAPGTTYSLGTTGTAFTQGALWQVDPTAPGFSHHQGIWGASMRFRDLTGAYGDSPVYTFLIEPHHVPAPGAAAVLGMGGMLAARRRRARA